MASVSLTKNESIVSLKASKYVQEHRKLSASNPFDALCDEDSGDDVITKAVAQLKDATMSEPDKTKKANGSNNGKEKVNNIGNGNNVNSRGGYSKNSRYPSAANGQRGAGQRRRFDGYNNRYQNGWYRGNGAKSSNRSSNGTDDGASDKAERGSVKSEREQAEEEFQKKLKDFKYNPEEEEKQRRFLAKFSELIAEKEAAIKKLEASDAPDEKVKKAIEDRDKVLKDKADALECIRLSESKKMTLDEFEKMKAEQRKALQAPKGEMRVVQSSDFDSMVVVTKKNFEEDSLSIMPVHKPEAKARVEAEKTEKVQKGKKKKTLLLSFGGSQSQGLNFPQQKDMYHGRPVPRRQVQSVKQNGAVPSPSSNLPDNFPALRSASGA